MNGTGTYEIAIINMIQIFSNLSILAPYTTINKKLV